MQSFFLYNWEVRDEYFRAFETVPVYELTKERHAGLGTILKTLFHIIDVEYSWMRAIAGKRDVMFDVAEFNDLPSIAALSNRLRSEVRDDLRFLSTESMEEEYITPAWTTQSFSKAEILKHMIAHEIHHVGQLSIWASELGIEPVSANFIGRDLIYKVRAMGLK
jgi:uncharacterized damage-inducible protein DinB